MLKRLTTNLLKPHAEDWVKDAGLKRRGTRHLMTWAKRYNRWLYSEKRARYEAAYRHERDALLRENGGDPSRHPMVLRDGWALDTSMSLPHLEELLRDANKIVDERGGKRHSDIQQPFLRSLLFPGDMEKYPSLVNFITSSEVLATVMDYMKTVPVLSMTRPPGVRFMESNVELDPEANGPFRASQLYHLDIHDTPLVYVLVAVRDITASCGPWTFLPDPVSAGATQALRYREKGIDYRVTDEQMYKVIDGGQAIPFTCARGSVLFIDSSRCFHYGSRNARPPRYQLMYGFTSVCRTDFSQTFMASQRFPVPENPSRLRVLVCQ
jgi:hypothetical protein